jgi:hypothetical protein
MTSAPDSRKLPSSCREESALVGRTCPVLVSTPTERERPATPVALKRYGEKGVVVDFDRGSNPLVSVIDIKKAVMHRQVHTFVIRIAYAAIQS